MTGEELHNLYPGALRQGGARRARERPARRRLATLRALRLHRRVAVHADGVVGRSRRLVRRRRGAAAQVRAGDQRRHRRACPTGAATSAATSASPTARRPPTASCWRAGSSTARCRPTCTTRTPASAATPRRRRPSGPRPTRRRRGRPTRGCTRGCSPYFVALATQAHATGAPIIRARVPRAPRAAPSWRRVDDAYYFGPSLFVAPVVTRGARAPRTVELPAGRLARLARRRARRAAAAASRSPAPLDKLPLLLLDGYARAAARSDDRHARRGDRTRASSAPADVADVYDVVAFLTAQASFALPDGTSFRATLAGAVAPPALPEASDEATLATCSGCYRLDDLGGGLVRLRASVSGDGTVTAGGLTLTATHARPRTRWDIYTTAP